MLPGMRIADFTATPPITLSDRTISNAGLSGPRTATLTIANDGKVKNHVPTDLETWLGAGSASSWDVKATLQSGTSPSGSAVGSWLNLGTSRSWSLTDSTADGVAVTCTLFVEIAPTGTTTPSDTATITISAEVIT